MKAVVDRIENDIAILLCGDSEEKVNIPLKLLPEGIQEGSWLNINFELNNTGEQQQKEKITQLLDKLKHKDL